MDSSGMIGPVRERLARVDARALQAWEPATCFDPLRVARQSPPAFPAAPTPATGEGPVAAWGRAIRDTGLSPIDLCRAALGAARRINSEAHVFITLDFAGAMAAATQAEAELRAGSDRGPLHGLPVAVKDIVETAGLRTTGGSRLRADHVPARDAHVVARLRGAGAVILGKANTHEFAAGPSGENPHYGTPRNPWSAERVPGGSSSGTAVAVALGLCGAGIGTDTGGSVRIPAACCGIVGIKPTYGRVSRAGVFPLSWSLDHVGSMALTVGDAAAFLGAIAGPDAEDPASAPWPVPDFAARFASTSLRGVRIGVPAGWLDSRVQPGVRAAFDSALRALEGLGAAIRSISLEDPDELAPLNRAIAFAEGSAYHFADLRAHPEVYGGDVRARNEAGLQVTGVEYLQAQRLRAEFCRRFAALWGSIDAVATPTLPVVAPRLGEATGYGADLIRFTAFVDLLGLPAVSVPCGLAEGLPVGLQLIGQAFAEPALLRLAAAYEIARGPWPAAPGAVKLA